MKIIERLLSKNCQLMQDRLDGAHFVEYKVKAEEVVKIIMWLALASLAVLAIRCVDFSSLSGSKQSDHRHRIYGNIPITFYVIHFSDKRQ